MQDQVADHAKDWLTLSLAGLGISFAPYEWLGGLFLALAGAAFAMRSDPEQDRRELWLVMLGAFLASHVAALIWWHWPPTMWSIHAPVQAVMLGAGFLSRRLTRLALRVAGMVEARSDRIADRIADRIDRTIGPADQEDR